MTHAVKIGGTSGLATTRRKDGLAWYLIAVAALAPIPFASNRPFFWAAWAATTGLCCVVYLLTTASASRTFSEPIASLRGPLLLWAAFCLFALFQALPLSAFSDGTEVSSATGVQFHSAYLSLAPGATLLAVIRNVGYALFFFLAVQASAIERRRFFMLHAILLIVTVHALYALVSLKQLGDTILLLPKWGYIGSATGSFVNRNSFATFLAFGLVIATSLLISPPPDSARSRGPDRIHSRLLVFAQMLILVATIMATQSRMGALAATCGVVLTASIGILKESGVGVRHKTKIVLAGGALAVVSILYGANLAKRFDITLESAEARGALYTQVLEMINARPLLGYGGDSFELAYPLFHRPPVPTDLMWDKAHSTYLALWVEYGMVAGSLPLLALCLIAIPTCRSLWRTERSFAAEAAGFGAIVVASVHSTADFSLEIQANALLFLLLLGIGVGASRDRQPRAVRSPTDGDVEE